MTDDQLSTLSQELRARLKGKCASDEALYMDLFAAFVQLVASGEELCEEYAMFERDSEANYAYGDAPESHLFSEGVYWCAARLRKEIMAMKTKAVRAHVVRGVAKRHRGLLVAIKDTPDITQQELASKLQKSKSNLAQILSRLEPHHLFIVIPDGRYKKVSHIFGRADRAQGDWLQACRVRTQPVSQDWHERPAWDGGDEGGRHPCV